MKSLFSFLLVFATALTALAVDPLNYTLTRKQALPGTKFEEKTFLPLSEASLLGFDASGNPESIARSAYLTPSNIGSTVQAYHARLQNLTSLTAGTFGFPYIIANNTWGVVASGGTGRSLLGAASADAAQTILGLNNGSASLDFNHLTVRGLASFGGPGNAGLNRIYSGSDAGFHDVGSAGTDARQAIFPDKTGFVVLTGEADGRVSLSPGSSEVTGQLSGDNILLQGSLESSSDSVQLVNDSANPGNSKYYGTNSSGSKGYFDLPSGGGGGSEQVKVTEYTTPGTYTYTPQPTGKLIRYRLVGGGGGGGAGPKGGGSTLGGGAGASGGAVIESVLYPTGSNLTIVIGPGGNGGAATSANDTSGANGSSGTSSTISDGLTLVTALPGAGGTGGGVGSGGIAGTGQPAGSYLYPNTAGATSGNGGAGGVGTGGTAGNGNTAVQQIISGSGGGGGGYNVSIPQGYNGGTGGPNGSVLPGAKAGGAGGVVGGGPGGGDAQNGSVNPYGFGTGGGGGAASLTGGTAKGGNGVRGSAGGGGGATLNGQAAGGAGGNGGAGYALIIEYY